MYIEELDDIFIRFLTIEERISGLKIIHIPLILILILIMSNGCNHGLQPVSNESELSNITGTITYTQWSSAGTIEDLRLIVFKNYPPENIQAEVLSGNAIVHPPIGEPGLPQQVDTTIYLFNIDPGMYEYIVVAQRYGPDAFNDWLAVGQYDTLSGDDFPTCVTIVAGKLLEEINIKVNFDSLPPQPF